MPMMSLLSEPLFSATPTNNNVPPLQLCLPELLARLSQGEHLEFSALRAHQVPAWHAFLVQIGALVTHRLGASVAALSEEEWRKGLLDLAGDAGEAAWSLVVTDLALPAFLQPPIPEGNLAAFKKIIPTPDDLDVLITTRNHDLKQGQMGRPRPEHWIYALVALQTMEGFLGRGNYGIARMNGGFSSRPTLTYAPGLGSGERFLRDVAVWRESREDLLRGSYGYPEEGGAALLWTLPWDGKKSRATPSECDPFFIEICRRIRLVQTEGGRVEARFAPSSAPFLDAKALQGDTGDAWTPVDKTSGSSLTVPGSGFSYRLLSRLLFTGDFRLPAALHLRAEDSEEPVLLAQVLVRGQGKTEGFHERVLPIPKRARRFVSSPDERSRLAELAQARIEDAKKAQTRVLRPALCALLQGGRDKLDFRDDGARIWLDRLDAAIDRAFFTHLWAAAEMDPSSADHSWHSFLRDEARELLEEAIHSVPIPLAVYPRAVARAEGLFHAIARKELPGAYADTSGGPPPSEPDPPSQIEGAS